ncbi:hypothetical protein V8B97DRAFT_1928966 [Scleroderma yunnanense]
MLFIQTALVSLLWTAQWAVAASTRDQPKPCVLCSAEVGSDILTSTCLKSNGETTCWYNGTGSGMGLPTYCTYDANGVLSDHGGVIVCPPWAAPSSSVCPACA